MTKKQKIGTIIGCSLSAITITTSTVVAAVVVSQSNNNTINLTHKSYDKLKNHFNNLNKAEIEDKLIQSPSSQRLFNFNEQGLDDLSTNLGPDFVGKIEKASINFNVTPSLSDTLTSGFYTFTLSVHLKPGNIVKIDSILSMNNDIVSNSTTSFTINNLLSGYAYTNVPTSQIQQLINGSFSELETESNTWKNVFLNSNPTKYLDSTQVAELLFDSEFITNNAQWISKNVSPLLSDGLRPINTFTTQDWVGKYNSFDLSNLVRNCKVNFGQSSNATTQVVNNNFKIKYGMQFINVNKPILYVWSQDVTNIIDINFNSNDLTNIQENIKKINATNSSNLVDYLEKINENTFALKTLGLQKLKESLTNTLGEHASAIASATLTLSREQNINNQFMSGFYNASLIITASDGFQFTNTNNTSNVIANGNTLTISNIETSQIWTDVSYESLQTFINELITSTTTPIVSSSFWNKVGSNAIPYFSNLDLAKMFFSENFLSKNQSLCQNSIVGIPLNSVKPIVKRSVDASLVNWTGFQEFSLNERVNSNVKLKFVGDISAITLAKVISTTGYENDSSNNYQYGSQIKQVDTSLKMFIGRKLLAKSIIITHTIVNNVNNVENEIIDNCRTTVKISSYFTRINISETNGSIPTTAQKDYVFELNKNNIDGFLYNTGLVSIGIDSSVVENIYYYSNFIKCDMLSNVDPTPVQSAFTAQLEEPLEPMMTVFNDITIVFKSSFNRMIKIGPWAEHVSTKTNNNGQQCLTFETRLS